MTFSAVGGGSGLWRSSERSLIRSLRVTSAAFNCVCQQLARDFQRYEAKFSGCHLAARGYFVIIVGMGDGSIKKYDENQDTERIRLDKLER